jgi:hypothetical protein
MKHFPYWNPVLKDHYCHADGEPWPCLHHRRKKVSERGSARPDAWGTL